ncbi:hypothetical protein ACFVUH_14565 [Kitasatospora sp. NPDC058032]|uniref:hypothetical protein n=1 Tax=Kitasatospora sp. NPDC058032 TaxID=3346307 RepID=UPI0036D83524
MNATPEGLSQQAEREELARLLPAAAARGLSPHRHLLRKEHLMNALTKDALPAPAVRRRGLALRLALPVGLAVAAAGIALTSLPGDPAGRGRSAAAPAVPATTSPAASPSPLERITNATYELAKTDDRITIVVLDSTTPVDTGRLKRDLDRLGIRTRVFGDEPGCGSLESMVTPVPKDAAGKNPVSPVFIEASTRDGRTVYSIDRSKLDAGGELLLHFPAAQPGPGGDFGGLEAGVLFGAAGCAPSVSPVPTPSAG